MNNQTKPIILITGSSRGIGASVARLSKQYGYEVILHGKTKSDNLLKIAKELESNYLYFDVTKEKEIKSGLNEVSYLNALVNSAGINISKSFEKLTSYGSMQGFNFSFSAHWKSLFFLSLME